MARPRLPVEKRRVLIVELALELVAIRDGAEGDGANVRRRLWYQARALAVDLAAVAAGKAVDDRQAMLWEDDASLWDGFDEDDGSEADSMV